MDATTTDEEDPHIVVVDDEPDVRETIAEYLALQGFRVTAVNGGRALRETIAANPADLVILDINMPGEDGLTLARFLREHQRIGIVMLTAAGGVVDRIVGLEVGADDYIAKPFDPRELRARLKSVLRRLQPAETKTVAKGPQRIPVGRCQLDLRSRQLSDAQGREVPLTAMEFDLLKAFVDHPNQVLTRDRLLTLTRNRQWEPFDRSIDIRITRLRRKVEADPDHPRVIKTVRGAGYLYVPPEQ